MATASDKFGKSITLREWSELERNLGLVPGENMSQLLVVAGMLAVAKRRQSAGFEYDKALDFTPLEANEELVKELEALGFHDDEEEAVIADPKED